MRKRYLIAGVAFAGLVAAALAGNTARNVARFQPLTRSPAEAEALLAPAWRLVMPPENAGFAPPYKAAVVMSGCDGVHDNMELWAGVLADHGRATLILDSHGPRGLDQLQSWRAVCAAQILPGAERAADLAVAIAAMGRMEGIDTSDIAVLGASHGGWSIMELLELLGTEAPPPGLAAWPEPRAELAARIGPVVLLYPYCGVVSGAGDAHWPANAEGLMVLAGEDSIVDPQKCREMAAGLVERGADLTVATLAGADHGFDQKEHSVVSSLVFDQGLTDQAEALVSGLLAGHEAGAPAL